MEHRLFDYELGFQAALAGKTEKDCPYDRPERMDRAYRCSPYHEWMWGFREGKEACPHCKGTGKTPELSKEQRIRKGLNEQYERSRALGYSK